MAKLSFRVQADYDKVQRLREEISKLKQEVGNINAIQNPTAFNALNGKLQGLSKELDSVVTKIVEANARLMESAARIDKAVDTITKAQEKASKANSQQTAATDKGQAAAIEVQAKAYLDLKDDIDGVLGTREQNIRQMLREQNAIKLINAEIAQINKSQQYGGGLSATQSQRLQQLNDDLLTHKQALAEVRQELNNNTKLDLAAVGSMNELSQSLARMRIAYRALNEDERNSQFGQNLLKSIQEADARIKELDATIGNHQRNVGNYQSFNGLNMSVQQIVRELPSATMGVNMFFMAISNNLPIMADQIKLAKEANKAMKAAGGEPVPVWKQLVSSLFSWQTAMMVGITLLTVYGKDIANWVKGLFKANDAQEQARKEAEAFANTIKKSNEEWRNSVAQTAGQQISAYRKMQREWDALGNNLNAKKKYVDANKTAFNQLGFAVNGVSDAERVMTGNTNAVVASIMARAKAAAYYAQMQEATERYIKQTEYNKGTVKGGGYYDTFNPKNGQITDVSIVKGLVEGKDYTKQMSGAGAYAQLVYTLTKSGISKENARRERESAKKLAINQRKAKAQLDKQLSSLQGGLESVTKENQDLLKKIGVSEYKDYEETNSPKGGKNEKAGKVVDYAKITREQSDAERELAYQVAQSRIDAEEDAAKREQMQRALNHKKELDDIEKQKNDLIQKHIANAKEIFEADPKNKGKKFDGSKITLTEAEQKQYDEIRANIIQKQQREDAEAERMPEAAMRDYLKQYGTYQEKKVAISQEYAEKIAKATTEGEKKSLRRQEQSEYNNLDLEELKKNINWEYIFGNLDNVDAVTAGAAKDQLEQFVNLSKELTPEQIKTVTDAMVQLQDKMDLTEPLRSIKDARKEYALAKTEFDKYSRELDAAKVSGDAEGQKKATEGMIKASQNMSKAKSKEEKSFKAVTDLVQEYARALQEAGDIIGGTAGECVGLAASALSAGVSMAQGIEKFGQAVSSMEKAVAILAIIEAALQAIQVIINVFGDSADATLTEYVSTMDTYIKMLDNDINSLNDSMGDAKNTMKETIAYYDKLVALEKESALAVKSQSQVWLNSGASKGFLGIGSKASEGVKIVKQMKESLKSGNAEVRKFYEDGYNALNEFFAKVNGRMANSVSEFGRLDWIWKMSDEDLAKLSEDTNAMAMLGDTLSSSIKEYVDKMGTVKDKLNEEFASLLNVSYDEFYDGFTEMISEMDNDSQNFADHFAEYMRNALIKDMVASKYKSQLESIFKQAGQYAQDGTLDKHVDELRNQYARLASSAQEQVRMINDITGYTGTDSQNATANGISNISYDQADNLTGIMTSMQIAGEQRNAKLDTIAGHLSIMDVTTEGIRRLMAEQMASSSINGSATSEIINNSYTPQIQVSFPKEELQDIKQDVRELRGIVDEMRTHGAERLMEQREISENTGKMVKNGMEIKSYVGDIKKAAQDMAR